jgi:hypothetical protein
LYADYHLNTPQFTVVVESEAEATYRIVLYSLPKGSEIVNPGWAYAEPEAGKHITIQSPREFRILPVAGAETEGFYQ